MGRIKDTSRLFGEFVAFARYHRSYWIIPLIIVLGLTGLLVVAGQAAMPLLYALF